MLLCDDVMYQILQWLPVISLLRFKLVCGTWRALIESNSFIKQHLHHHHYDPYLKDKNHSLIHIVSDKGSPFTFPLISIDSFEEPNACAQLDCSDLRESFPLAVHDIVSYNGIICLNLLNGKGKQSICLWNPATKQSRVLPRSPALTLEMKYSRLPTIIGFGFDAKNNDYKVVNLCGINHPYEQRVEVYSLINTDSYPYGQRVEVYSLNTDSWRSITTDFPFTSISRYPRMPFNNGTCFFWNVSKFESQWIHCFDFSSEKFRSISFPDADYFKSSLHASVVSDKIACVFVTNDCKTEIWVFNEYGSMNESWVKLYMIRSFPASMIYIAMSVKWLSMNGDHLFFSANGPIIRYNVVTKEIKFLSTVEKHIESSEDCRLPTVVLDSYYCGGVSVGFKESLVSVHKGNE